MSLISSTITILTLSLSQTIRRLVAIAKRLAIHLMNLRMTLQRLMGQLHQRVLLPIQISHLLHLTSHLPIWTSSIRIRRSSLTIVIVRIFKQILNLNLIVANTSSQTSPKYACDSMDTM